MTSLFLSIACLALLNAARLTIAKACVRTARIVRAKVASAAGAAKVRCTFAA